MEYRKGDAPFHILIEEDGDIVFYETLIEKDDEEIIKTQTKTMKNYKIIQMKNDIK